MILVTLGTGVGGGIIVNDKIIAGSHGAAGEIGHAHVDDSIKDPCNCGNCGCLEQVASATGIVRLAKEELAAWKGDTLLKNRPLSAKAVFDSVKEGDELSIRNSGTVRQISGKSAGCVRLRYGPGSVRNRRRRVKGRPHPAYLYRKILSGVRFPHLPAGSLCPGYPGQ